MNEKKFQEKIAEAFAQMPAAKISVKMDEARARMRLERPRRQTFKKLAQRILEMEENNRLVPGFKYYQVIGQASAARIYPNTTSISLRNPIYLPDYTGPFMLVDTDSASKKLYQVIDINDRNQLIFSPPLGGTDFVEPTWLIACTRGVPVLNLTQAWRVVEWHRRQPA